MFKNNLAIKIYENDNARKNHLFNTNISRELCDILLYDNTSCKNLIWGTDNYKQYGAQCSRESEIKNGLRNDAPYSLIKPRFLKNKEEQQIRSKEKAEVFTPSWICNAQNNLIDNDWFESENVFNAEVENGWITNTKKIKFSKKKEKSWRDYILQKRLEITCGEAPYLTSRYDSVLGVYIEPEDRIGLLDRKLRVINEQVVIEDDWIEWALIAVKNVYGYDFQGDNVFIARQNILATIMDFYMCKFDKILPDALCLDFAKIISWNIWQMDGLKFVIPYSCKKTLSEQLSLFDSFDKEKECEGCQNGSPYKHTGIYCKIMDWERNKKIRFVDLFGNRYHQVAIF